MNVIELEEASMGKIKMTTDQIFGHGDEVLLKIPCNDANVAYVLETVLTYEGNQKWTVKTKRQNKN